MENQKTDPNAAAHPVRLSDSDYRENFGLTKREYFAIHEAPGQVLSVETMEELIGKKWPGKYHEIIERIKFSAEVDAAVRVIYADALIAELNKPQPNEPGA